MPDKPTIPEPYSTVPSLYAATTALKEGYEMLTGQRGGVSDCAVTWGDLLSLGIVKPEQVPPHVGSDRLRK